MATKLTNLYNNQLKQNAVNIKQNASDASKADDTENKTVLRQKAELAKYNRLKNK